jgi:pimeloyl-ACP methyl ester carboxylesterase
MQRVVLVHGLWTPGVEMLVLGHRLRACGYRTSLFPYHSMLADLETNAARLAAFLEGARGDTLHLLGHSLGGVIAVKTIQSHSVERLGRVVCLGSPLNGSSSARRLSRLPGGRRLLAKSEGSLTSGALQPWSKPGDLGLIAGSLPIGLGSLFGSLPKPNDGVVSVDETRFEGATAHLTLRVSHFSMLWSRAVAEQVAHFLATGLFIFQPTGAAALGEL